MKPVSIAILGGGPGGLFAAHLLQKRSPVPLAITIFEATDRLGGKVRTGRFASADVPYEIGAAELYDYSKLGHDPLRELVEELGLKTHPMRGETVVLDGHILKTNADLELAYGTDAVRAFKQFCKYARNAISPAEYYESDWKVDNEDPLTNCSFRALLDKVTHPDVRRYIEIAVHSDVAAEPHQTHASYGLQNWLMNEPGYMKLYTVDGGNQRITDEVAKRVAAKKLLRHRVTAVGLATQGGYDVTSTGPEGERTDRFDTVVAALPNHWLPAIRWRGEKLDRAMERHHKHYDHPAHYLRVTALFRTPFWRNQIDDSYFMIDSFGGACVYDESSRGESHPYGVLGWLLGGEAAAAMSNLSDTELAEVVIDSLPKQLGDAKAQRLETRVHRWIGSVNAMPGGRPLRDPEVRHTPEPEQHPGLFTVGDYLFDSTLNGVLDSAEWVAETILENVLEMQPAPISASR